MKAVLLQYNFLFDPADTWSSLYDFEQDLLKFFDSKTLEAEIVKSVEGQNGIRILLIRKRTGILDSIPQTSEPRKGRPQSVQGKIKELTVKNVTAKARDFGNKKLKTDKIFNKAKKK